jgi:hypothetical protein
MSRSGENTWRSEAFTFKLFRTEDMEMLGMHVQSYRSGPRHYIAANVPVALHPFQRASNTHRIEDWLVVRTGVEGFGEHDSLQPLLDTITVASSIYRDGL